MNNTEIINNFLLVMKEKYGIDYLNDSHCIGILFYGSRKGSFATSISDLDLCIVYDDTITFSTKGLEIVDGIEVEYFEKSISDLIQVVDSDYEKINSAPLSMYGMAEIIFERNKQMSKLQEYIRNKYSKPFLSCSIDELHKDSYYLNNRLVLLEKMVFGNDPNFDLMFFTILDRIKTFYHKINGITRLEISKSIHSYMSLEYANKLLLPQIDEEYKRLFIAALNSSGLSYEERFSLLLNLFNYVNKDQNFDYKRIKCEEKRGFNQVIPLSNIGIENRGIVSLNIQAEIQQFIETMGYKKKDGFVGIIVHGDDLNYDDNIELEIIALFNNSDRDTFVGTVKIGNTTFKYTETSFVKKKKSGNLTSVIYPINQLGYLINTDTYYSVIADTEQERNILLDYIANLVDKTIPRINENKYKEELSVIRNRLQRLNRFAFKDDFYCFDMYYNVILDKIIFLYRRKINSIYINPTDVDNQMFLNFFNKCIECKGSKQERLEMITHLYNFMKGSIILDDNYRIVLKKNNSSKVLAKES